MFLVVLLSNSIASFTASSYLIPERTIGLFFYGCTFLLVTNIDCTNWVNLGTRKLPTLQDTNLYLEKNAKEQ